MTFWGWVILIVGALLVGGIAQWAMNREAMAYRWVITAVATFLGALASSEWLFANATPEIEGIALWPALIGGLIVGLVVDFIAQRYAAGEAGHGPQGHGAAVR